MQASPSESSAAETKNILVLHSYHQGLVWTDKIMEGIYSVFNKYDPRYEIHVEYMDTKRYYDGIEGIYLTRLRDVYKGKHAVLKPDIIIASDDYAFQFLLMYGDQLFPGTPVVFCGVNDFVDAMLAGRKHITGVTEFLDIKANIENVLNLHPDTEQIAIITDTTVPGIINRSLLEQLAATYKDRVEFVFIDRDNTGLTLQELLEKLRQLPEKSIVYYSDFLRSRDEYIVQETAVPQISAVSRSPIYTHYDEILGLGIVGGDLTSGYSHGRKAAQMAADILRGTPVSSLPVYKESINTFMFDHKQLTRFGIDEHALPEGSEIINRPSSFYSQYKRLVWTVLGVFSVLVISLITISLNVVKRKKAEEKLQIAHDELEQKVEERTRSLNKANLDLHAEVEERRLAENALAKAKMTAEEEKAKMDAIIASIGEGISIQDPDFRVMYQNQHHIDMVGYHVGEFCYSGYQKKDRVCENCHLALSFQDGKIHRKEQKRTTDQGTFYFEIISSPIIDPSGSVIAGIEAVRDITEQKNAEKKLRDSENRFRAAFENAAVGASMVDLEGKFIKVNRRLCEMLGYAEHELLSRTFSDVTYPEDIPIGLKALKEMIAGNSGYHSFEKRYIHKDGHIIYLIISPSLIRDLDGRPMHFLGLFQDITRRKEMETQIISSLQEKEVLLKEIHHRVKNNMTVVHSMLELQSHYIHDERDREMFRQSMNRIKSMAIIHEKLYQSKDLARIHFSSYLKQMIEDMFTSYGLTKDRISLKIDVNDIYLGIDSAIPCGLIINELVSNSLKYAFPDIQKGEVIVSLSTGGSDEYELVVSDNGIGLPDGLDAGSAQTLGMTLVKALVKQLQGTIETKRGKGTEFRITFSKR